METRYEHIEVNEKGVPTIAGTRMKVAQIVIAQRAYGWSPEELRFQYPHLTLGQIHSALAYYHDHSEEMDLDIERRDERVEELRRKMHSTHLAERIKARRDR